MNENRAGALFPTLVMGGVALFVLLSILLTEGNTVGEFCRYLLVGGFVFSLVAPRMGFYTWLFLCGYNDLLKRLMILGGRVNYEDLRFVLGITPAMFGGIVMALFVGGLLKTQRILMRDLVALMVGCVLMVGMGALAYLKEGGGLNGVLQAMANSGLYALLLFVIPVMFPTEQALYRLWRVLVFIFLPVAVYGVVQQVQGFADFEVEYLSTGLSLEVKQLVSGEVRAFSTLNSPTSLSVVCASLCVVSLWLGFGSRNSKGRPYLPPFLAVACAAIHAAGLVASTSRTPILILAVALFGGWCFFSIQKTRVFYALAVGGFLALVVASPWLVQHMDFLNQKIGSLASRDTFLGRMLIVGTYWDRLQGFATVLMNPDAYTFFGWGINEHGLGRFHFHDPLSEVLVRFGALALLFLMVSGAWFLWVAHHRAWQLKDELDRRFAARMIAMAAALVAVSLISGSVLTVFPNNVIFWLALSGVFALSRTQALAQKEKRLAEQSAERGAVVRPQGRIAPLRPRSRLVAIGRE